MQLFLERHLIGQLYSDVIKFKYAQLENENLN